MNRISSRDLGHLRDLVSGREALDVVVLFASKGNVEGGDDLRVSITEEFTRDESMGKVTFKRKHPGLSKQVPFIESLGCTLAASTTTFNEFPKNPGFLITYLK